MNIDIQAEAITPRRQTFSHIARRFGVDKPASRYEEATFDVQPVTNFHYRPTWDPERELFDPRRTAVEMADWYSFRDPRQFYYATYNINRAAMQQSFDDAVGFVDKRDLIGTVDADWLKVFAGYLLPLRHVEWAANMNCQLIADWGYGTQITSAASFCGTDRLGIAQIISRIGLVVGAGTDEALVAAKAEWMEAPEWQPMRRLAEDLLVVRDWFEVFVAQLVVLDGYVYPLVTQAFDRAGAAHNGAPLSMMTGFLADWYADNSRWTDAVIKTAAAESGGNRKVLKDWFDRWTRRAEEAVRPIADRVLGDRGLLAVAEAAADLRKRMIGLGALGEKELAA
ncbi:MULTISPECIES: aromatic/alkene monooxygenase hydroxylase subunit beta [Sphingomonas]|uniref:Aromatic/alkene monooxygenase hydroxylase subunit beta n=1 Tax=Sphingomonas kyungheensis TaxID=1069987 RepID=A0ABU8H6L5_9SPHN|nr:aromatic/alkene monooxygenase hydroxylase subunit beta [Sphingomonas sp. CV7422]